MGFGLFQAKVCSCLLGIGRVFFEFFRPARLEVTPPKPGGERAREQLYCNSSSSAITALSVLFFVGGLLRMVVSAVGCRTAPVLRLARWCLASLGFSLQRHVLCVTFLCV